MIGTPDQILAADRVDPRTFQPADIVTRDRLLVDESHPSLAVGAFSGVAVLTGVGASV